MTRTKNSIKLLGLEVNKLTYNSIMWLIIAGLAACLVIGFLVFKRNLYSIHHIKKELSELKEEFEAYRKSAREAREKMSMEHFNEIKKLRGGMSLNESGIKTLLPLLLLSASPLNLNRYSFSELTFFRCSHKCEDLNGFISRHRHHTCFKEFNNLYQQRIVSMFFPKR